MPLSAKKMHRIALNCQKHMRELSPVDTGNMQQNISVVQDNPRQYSIKIGGNVAPYAVYTNEKWVSPRWHGRKNPNEKWIDSGVISFVTELTSQLNGELSYDEKEAQERWDNKNYWDSAEGQRKLQEYKML